MVETGHTDAGQKADQLLSIVVPVYNEADNIVPLLEAIRDGVRSRHETLIVFDFEDDTTLPPARAFASGYDQLRLVKNDYGKGVLNALRTGLGRAAGDVVVVTMADLSDDISQIDDLATMARSGAAVVAASRYMAGGGQVGGPMVKSTLSRVAGLTLHWLTKLGTHDPTNNFKAYRAEFIENVEIESRSGFELALELTAKAHLAGYDVREIPTVWQDRAMGESRFQTLRWLPSYLHWYWVCIAGTWSGQAARARHRRSMV